MKSRALGRPGSKLGAGRKSRFDAAFSAQAFRVSPSAHGVVTESGHLAGC
jgi:hypothetical protein